MLRLTPTHNLFEENTPSTSHCKYVEQFHIWGDKTRAAHMLFGYV